MNFLNPKLSSLAIFFTINLITALPGPHEISEIAVPQGTGAVEAPSYITQIWSSTEFAGTCGQEAPAPTLLLSIGISTVTTIQPAVTTYPATILETVITKWTVEYDFYYTESSHPSIRSGITTQLPTTTVLLGPPNITPAFRTPATGTLCGCPLQTALNITPCGAICCLHTTYPTLSV
ncbi:hypothetical protein N431DRAFT_474403 [Stipitochalara longipes BDJ]|nr:hypothetical protein N431DRAFT_474403 [Stipitochalara longipes BDJ]